MMAKPEDIPADVFETARQCFFDAPYSDDDTNGIITAIARAILDERERCANLAEVRDYGNLMVAAVARAIAAAIRGGSNG